ncbi:S-methyl-5-thioribose-1-phosphate isomerase [Streptomyces enissocaesilis]
MPPAQPSLRWEGDAIVALDQRALPLDRRMLRLATVDDVIDAIATLAVRGAPAIGLAGAMGVALSAFEHCRPGTAGTCAEAVHLDAQRLIAARPTAVNLAWAVRRALERVPEGADAVLRETTAMLQEDITTNRTMVGHAVDTVLAHTPDRPLRVLTHCNTGRLATAAVGTALGTIVALAAAGRIAEVLVGETRPLLQGARLTTWELAEAGVAHRLCVDSAPAAAMSRGLVDCVLVGADRITANGDVANKIGTYSLAVAAAHHRIPFIVVAPESSWDRSLADGSSILIEERDDDEVTGFGPVKSAPPGTRTYNPAFDVTPAQLITAIVSEHGAHRPER